MKRILSVIVLVAAWFINSHAQGYYYVQGPNTYFAANWADNAADRMNSIEHNNTRRYYLVKQFTVNASTSILYRVHRAGGNGYTAGYFTYSKTRYDYNNDGRTNSQNDAATLYFENAGTYWVIFCIDLRNDTEVTDNGSSLDAVVLANISEDFFEDNNPRLWSEQAMTFDPTDNMFHLRQEVYAPKATTGRFKAKVRHRKTNNDVTWYGTDGYGNGNDISVAFEKGHYEMEFTFDPIRKTAPTVTIQGYHDHKLNAEGYSTFSYHKVLDVPEDLTAHFITSQNSLGFLAMKTTLVPKTTTTPEEHTGVILRGTPNETYRLYWSADQNATVPNQSSNMLSGTGSSKYENAPAGTYCFTKVGDFIGFYPATSGDYDPQKAFLPASAVSSSREFFAVDVMGGTEGVAPAVMGAQPAGQCYTLQGQPVARPQKKGIYVVGGRKVVMK